LDLEELSSESGDESFVVLTAFNERELLSPVVGLVASIGAAMARPLLKRAIAMNERIVTVEFLVWSVMDEKSGYKQKVKSD
jgi:hypothetical protein